MAVAILFFTVGFVSAFLPVVPGSAIAWLGIVIHKLWLWDNSVSWTFFFIATGLVLFVQLVDIACTYWGAKRYGATWRGALGAVIGGIIGAIVFNIAGLILGPIVGAVVGEALGGSTWRKAGKAGLGTIVGGIVAYFIKLGATAGLIGGFFLFLPASN